MRTAEIKRDTFETKITMKINLDGTGINSIATGIGFFDHMLTHISKHGFVDMDINAEGDTEVDCHHTIEDVGIVLGKCIAEALGDKSGIKRYGFFILPMDEALILCSMDISGRAYLNFDVEFPTERCGDMDMEMVEEFFRAVSANAGIDMHIKMLAGKNSHHIAEGVFKAFGKALDMAVSVDGRIKGVLSTKGMLEV
ncbi:imidazoleglycerol-phosphate dehydratase HisB [Lachnospiraceae bacterium NSJ-143]|nr:imidazoleglycerol-phosphate dehydratase HisB [Lachnospiraceae bacterium NSJ-143]